MTAILGVVKDGRIDLTEPVVWPEGTAVQVSALCSNSDRVHEPAEHFGSMEDEQGDDPASIAQWIADFDAIPPLEMTPEEEVQWQDARKVQREVDAAREAARLEQLRSLLP